MGPRAGPDRCGKSGPQPGSDPRTVQPVASRYTDRATRPKGTGNKSNTVMIGDSSCLEGGLEGDENIN